MQWGEVEQGEAVESEQLGGQWIDKVTMAEERTTGLNEGLQMDRLCGKGRRKVKMPVFGAWKYAKQGRDEMQCNTDKLVPGMNGMTKL
ncbi:hypothetical protein CFAM422_002228 [Trichoderma lentiforme]|uniref:Uncharacterized protein n=1 Tax=Trichoderma lentiforme TaxID=1567552 RepID=A0A9P4XMG5_9HYPO|nr:hypothetical protein CFAM422_002228 [Trichoderma lentiforme]